jgi:hypothetical protein
MHGLNADRTEADGIGEGLAAYGFAVFSFDLIYHGERGPNSDTLRLLEFFNFFEPFKWRANFQQDVSDEMWLTHLVRNLGDLDLAPYSTGGDGVPDLDLSHIVFMGHSLGAIHGGIVAAVDDAQSVFVYNSAAADYRALAMQSPTGESILEVVQALDGDLDWDAYSRAMMIIDLLLAVVELGDPMAYAPYVFDHPLPKMTVPRQMLFEMAAYDSSLGAAACGRFATVLGLTQLEPVVWRLPDTPLGQTPFAGPAVYQYDTDVHGFWWEIDQPHLQAGHFLDTWRDTGFGEIIDPYQP